jgi:hypothetical protein
MSIKSQKNRLITGLGVAINLLKVEPNNPLPILNGTEVILENNEGCAASDVPCT